MKTPYSTLVHPWLAVVAFGCLGTHTVGAQTFTVDYPLLAARWLHSANLLPNGLVLVSGGRIANDYSTSNWANTNCCELYNPATISSTLTGPMADSHTSGGATLLPTGKVISFAGENNGQYPTASAELYESESGTWTGTGSLRQERASFAWALLPNGKVFVAGGWDGGGGGELSSVEIYDSNTGLWTYGASMGYSADSQTATVLPDGSVLVAGGSFNGNALTNCALYFPANNTWANTRLIRLESGRR